MQYQVHPKSLTRENAQNLFSCIINEDDFSSEIRPCNFPTFIVLYHHAKFRKNSMTGTMKIMVTDGHTFPGSSSTATWTPVHHLNFSNFRTSSLQETL